MREIKRILIANRGEIALRALRTIQEMGKEAVVVHSTADKDALYVKYADATICIGESRSSESYLNIPAIITACEISEADAIFPGYGFLSENQNFVEICAKHNIKFIGPSVEAMALMSDKSKAKQVMMRAGIPVVPGSDGAIKDIEMAKKLASEIGYPVIIKAAAGGGGRGMRVVEKEEDLEKNFWSAESEAMSAFGDGTMYMEKYISNPRHIEVQVLGDEHGNVVHVGERDCSMQRRHQKLIEESPAVILDDATRANLHETAVRAAKAIGYAEVSQPEIAQIGQYAENVFFGKPCGLMDQTASAVGGLVTIDFADKDHPDIRPVNFDFSSTGHALCIIDSRADHADLTDEYAAIPGELKALCAHFGKEVTTEIDETEFYAAIPALRQKVGDRAVMRAIHEYNENRRVPKQVAALENGDFEAFLRLTKESGFSSWMYLQNVIPAGYKTEQAMAIALALCEKYLEGKGAYRVHGGGFAGTVQAFVPYEILDAFQAGIDAALGEGACHILSIRPEGGVPMEVEA